MLAAFIYLFGGLAIFLQFSQAYAAFDSGNFWLIRKAIVDFFATACVFFVANTGGVGGFFVAVVASFMVTVFLMFRKVPQRPEPAIWRGLKKLGNILSK